MKQSLFTRISEIAGQLQAEGKTPSLALIRGRLDLAATQAEIFSTYQQWRNQGAPVSHALQATPPAVAAGTTEVGPASADLPSLHERLSRIEAKLDLLLQRLAERD